MKRLHIVMPMCGAGSRFAEKGFEAPKPLLTLHGKPFFYWAAESALKCAPGADLTFVVLKGHIEHFNIDKAILEYYPGARIVTLDETPPGAVCTCMEGVSGLDGGAVLFNDCDHLFRSPDFADFCKNGFPGQPDGALLSFTSRQPKYSYLELDENGLVRHTVEKQVVSDHAICGAYYFADAALFQRAAEEYLKVCDYREYYLSGVYNVLASQGGKIVDFPVSLHISFGTPEEYEAALTADFSTI